MCFSLPIDGYITYRDHHEAAPEADIEREFQWVCQGEVEEDRSDAGVVLSVVDGSAGQCDGWH